MELFYNTNVLRTPHSRIELKGVNGVRAGIMSSRDDHVSKLGIRATLNEIAHPIWMETNGKVNCWDGGDTGRELTAIDA